METESIIPSSDGVTKDPEKLKKASDALKELKRLLSAGHFPGHECANILRALTFIDALETMLVAEEKSKQCGAV
jgi:hypothetical protein